MWDPKPRLRHFLVSGRFCRLLVFLININSFFERIALAPQLARFTQAAAWFAALKTRTTSLTCPSLEWQQSTVHVLLSFLRINASLWDISCIVRSLDKRSVKCLLQDIAETFTIRMSRLRHFHVLTVTCHNDMPDDYFFINFCPLNLSTSLANDKLGRSSSTTQSRVWYAHTLYNTQGAFGELPAWEKRCMHGFPTMNIPTLEHFLPLKRILTFFPHARGNCAKRECCKPSLWIIRQLTHDPSPIQVCLYIQERENWRTLATTWSSISLPLVQILDAAQYKFATLHAIYSFRRTNIYQIILYST